MDVPKREDFAFLPNDFEFREGQLEAIQKVIKAYNDGKEDVLIDAPTGSGKSIIALCLSYYFNKKLDSTGYILTSDLSLQDQYEDDIGNFRLNIPSVKGVDNYTCTENNEVISKGHCKLKGLNPKKLECYDACPYYSRRDSASMASTSLLNYSYWLTVRNYVVKDIFSIRDFIIFDEAHKLDTIVFDYFSPEISHDFYKKIDMVVKWIQRNINTYFATETFSADEWIKNYKLLVGENNKDNILNILNKIADGLNGIQELKKDIADFIKKNVGKENVSGYLMNVINDFNDIGIIATKINFILDIVKTTENLDGLIKVENDKDRAVKFYHIDSKYYFREFIRKQTGFRIYMSATFCNTDFVRENYFIDKDKSEIVSLESGFNYDNSAIYFVSNSGKMSYKFISESKKTNYPIIKRIVEENPNQRILIHAANYKITKDLGEYLKDKRVSYYTNRSEKNMALRNYHENSNGVLIGPSLTEGLDFSDDKCRIQIFAKTPFLNISDEFVKRKADENKMWYIWKSVINVIQGTGRGLRHKDDYVTTYIVDSSFMYLAKNFGNFFPETFKKRFKSIEK